MQYTHLMQLYAEELFLVKVTVLRMAFFSPITALAIILKKKTDSLYGQKNHRRIRALLYIMTDRAKPATTHNLGPTASQSVLLLDPRSRCCHSVGRSSPITQLRRCAQRKMNLASPLYSAPVLWPLPRTQYMCTNTHTNMENMSRSTSILWLWVTQSFSCVTPYLELQQWVGQKLLEGKI